jgi:hypothetical protein
VRRLPRGPFPQKPVLWFRIDADWLVVTGPGTVHRLGCARVKALKHSKPKRFGGPVILVPAEYPYSLCGSCLREVDDAGPREIGEAMH